MLIDLDSNVQENQSEMDFMKHEIEFFKSNLFEFNFQKKLADESEKNSSIIQINLKSDGFHKTNNKENFYFLSTICVLYLYRINEYKPLSLLYSYPISNNAIDSGHIYSQNLPLNIKLDSNLTLNQAKEVIKNQIDSLTSARNASEIFNKTLVEFSRKDRLKIKLVYISGEKNLSDIIADENLIFLIDPIKFSIKLIVNDKIFLSVLKNIKSHLKKISYLIFNNETIKLNNFNLMSDQEIIKITKIWNHTDHEVSVGKNIALLFKNRAREYKNKISIIFHNKKISYKRLDEESDQLALYLISKGLKQGDLAAIYLDRGVNFIIALLAILKAGAAYVPIDTSYPAQRINYILSNSNAALILTKSRLTNHIAEEKSNKIIEIDTHKKDIFKKSNHSFPNIDICANDIAYIIYTSGSTGNPKGVQITHKNVINYATWFSETFKLKKSSVIDFSSSISFDISVSCTLVPLLFGAKIAICNRDEKLEPDYYLTHLYKNKVSHIECTPDYFSHLLEIPEKVKKLIKLKWILLGGDAVIKNDIKAWLKLMPKHKLVNEYGPTECTVATTSYIVTNKNIDKYPSDIPIGKPAFNTKIYIVDKYQNLCPIGVPGELCISGDSVGLGYLDIDKTKNAFVDNPFSDNSKLYKTGDLACWLPDGNIDFLGRIDDQVKIRGFRIETREIEHWLLQYPNINQCKVLPDTNNNKEKYLIGYICSNHAISPAELRKFLRDILPEYMIPKKFIFLDKFPINSSGKIDISTLSRYKATYIKKIDIISSDNYIASKLLEIWQDLFGIEEIRSDDNFFDLGGYSLLALKLLTQINQVFGIKLKITVILRHPTIRSLTTLIHEIQATESLNIKENKTNIEPALIPLNSNRSGLPLFLIHPVGGTVFLYQKLASYLGDKNPIFALQDPGVENSNASFNSLQEMASVYIKAIKSIQDHGPYLLAGASFGAVLAFEICYQLQRQGDKILFLGMFDGWAKNSNALADKQFFDNLMRQKLLDADYNEQAANDLLNMQYSRESLLFKYDIPKLSVNISLFKAKELWPIFECIDEPYNWWRPYSNMPINLQMLTGDHETIFTEPHVKILARKLRQAINKAMLDSF